MMPVRHYYASNLTHLYYISSMKNDNDKLCTISKIHKSNKNFKALQHGPLIIYAINLYDVKNISQHLGLQYVK